MESVTTDEVWFLTAVRLACPRRGRDGPVAEGGGWNPWEVVVMVVGFFRSSVKKGKRWRGSLVERFAVSVAARAVWAAIVEALRHD
ncbi:hypothetical protein SSPO_065840 [Streptomyces antimycoticus]|uniref:Uncharacterized protein n=1 Tax=Streptomyces antimycoticus TaxID=68175 RepID=A0A499V6D4_9ACTN|nr:hypothetical protein SSPO_065840 [Streptomyces antimycoticus]